MIACWKARGVPACVDGCILLHLDAYWRLPNPIRHYNTFLTYNARESPVSRRIDFQTDPSKYRHWRVAYDGPIATLYMDVDENGGLFEGYQLKLNSYDLGVDIELADVVQRMRFEHPEVGAVVLRSGKDRVFCAGANIRMLGGADACAQGQFLQVHQRDPQHVRGRWRRIRPALHLRDKGRLRGRRLRVGAGLRPHPPDRRRLKLGRVAGSAAARGAAGHRRPDARHRQAQGAARSRRRVLLHRGGREGQARGGMAARRRGRRQFAIRGGCGRARARVRREVKPDGEREGRRADAARSHVRRRRLGHLFAGRGSGRARKERRDDLDFAAPTADAPASIAALHAQGAQTWALRLARELDDAMLHLRLNELELGVVVFKSHGDAAKVVRARSASCSAHRDGDWLAREILLYWKRVLKRIDLTSRSLVALDRERLVLRRRAGRDRFRLRPQLYDEGRVRGRQPRAGRDHSERRQFRAVSRCPTT